MSAGSPDVATELVVTGNMGTEVWCPNGDGNRVLEYGEFVGFPCPACGEPMTETAPDSIERNPVAQITLPTVGRIVHVLVSPGSVRPAIVCGCWPDGRCLVHIFKHPGDPVPPGLRGETATLGYGNELAQWHWPPKESAVKFDLFE